jgi:tetratricopeptide (TPR) repeat protein
MSGNFSGSTPLKTKEPDFLSATIRDLPARHRSLRVVFDHSWELLAEEEQKILLRLAVFRGGFRREAAEQVAGATLPTVSSLIAKSLVRRSGENRYDLHELVRQFATSKLGVDEQARTNVQHSRYYLDWLGQCTNRLRDHRQVETVAELTADIDNLRVAWDWAVAHLDAVRVCQASHALWYWLELRSWLTEGEMIFRNAAGIFQIRQAESKSDSDVQVPINAMRVYSAFFSLRLGKVPAAYATLLECAISLQAASDHLARIESLAFLGMASWQLRKLTEARESLQAGLELARACGEQWYETIIGEYLGSVIHDMGEQDLALRHLTEALTRARAIGDRMITIQALSFLGLFTLASGEMDPSEKFWRECLALAQEIRYRSGIGRALDGLGLVTRATDPQQADTWFTASAEMFRKTGDRTLALVLCHQGYNALVLGEKAKAQNAFVEALGFARQGGDVPFVLDALLGLATIEARNSSDESALELATYIAQHPAAAHDVKARAENLCAEIKSRLTPQQIETTCARTQATNLDQVASQILGMNSATRPSH